MRTGPPNPAPDDGHVLIVEDEPISRRALALLLTASGYHPATAASAEDALQQMKQAEAAPNIALVDVDLPGMSGLELAERLEAGGRSVFTVLITAAEGERIQSFLRNHDVAYVRKPIDFDHLLHVLSESRVQ